MKLLTRLDPGNSKSKKMFNRMIVQEALKSTWALDSGTGNSYENPPESQDSVISLLIHDVFGGEILKTHKKKGWHFYNRIDGVRVDFTRLMAGKSTERIKFEDIPSGPDETNAYIAQEDYSTFLMRFVRAFEEAVGLDHKPGYTA
jgi:hypothetical protein